MTQIVADTDGALEKAQSFFSGVLAGERKYGWGRKSAGSRIELDNGKHFWIRVQYAEPSLLNERLWNGEILIGDLDGVRKPLVVDYRDWTEGGLMWRATLMTFISDNPCSSTPHLRQPLDLPLQWYQGLRRSLEYLSSVNTDRICCRQDLINRRISERFGPVTGALDTTVAKWVTCHGDIHWANLTCPDLSILDWEVWGMGPQGLDPAFLLGYSCQESSITDRIEDVFGDELSTRDGLLSILFVCAELLRMIDLYGDHPGLECPLKLLADRSLERFLTRGLM